MNAMLIEHCAGALTAWMDAFQVMLIHVSERHRAYADKIAGQLKLVGVRVEVDTRNERMNAKIRDAQVQKVPYMLVVGDKEAAENAVAVRLRTNENLGAMPLANFVERITEVVKTRSEKL